MTDLFDNEFVQGVLLAIIGILILGVFGWLKYRRDEKIVTKYLQEYAADSKHTKRTTQAISSATDLSEERIRKICTNHSNVSKHPKQTESWKLSE